jgi:hypothetical protein
MRRNRPRQLALFIALVVTIGGATFSSPASSAPASSDQNANSAVKALVRPSLIRAEIVTLSAGSVNDFRVDRGVVSKIRGRLLTLAERDGTVVQVRLSPATQFVTDRQTRAAKRVRPDLHVTVMSRGSEAASWLYVARGSSDSSAPRIKSLLASGFVRAEVISWIGGAVLDNRVDTGVIESIDGTSLTLSESDGATVQMQIDSATQVQVNRQAATTTDLAIGMRATTIRSGEGAVGEVWAIGRRSSAGKK